MVEENKKAPNLFLTINIIPTNIFQKNLIKEHFYKENSRKNPYIRALTIPDSKKLSSCGSLFLIGHIFFRKIFNTNYFEHLNVWSITENVLLNNSFSDKKCFLIKLENNIFTTEIEVKYPSSSELIWKQGTPSEVAGFFLAFLPYPHAIANPATHYSLNPSAFQMIFNKMQKK